MKLICRNIAFLATITFFTFSIRATQRTNLGEVTCWGRTSEELLFEAEAIKVEKSESKYLVEREDISTLSNSIYRPSTATVGCGEDKKKIHIIPYPDLKLQPYIGWYESIPHKETFKKVAQYIPNPGVRYAMVHANSDGTLVAAGYYDDNEDNENNCVNYIDILTVDDGGKAKKLFDFPVPQKALNREGIMNIQFDDVQRLLIRTKAALYEYDLHRRFQDCNTAEINITKPIDNQNCSENLCAKKIRKNSAYIQTNDNSDRKNSCGQPLFLLVSLTMVGALCALLP